MTPGRAGGRVRMGVLGCADVAERRTLPAMLTDPRTRVVAVASRDRDKAARFATRFGCEAVHGYDPLLGRDDVDAVYVPLPAMLHAEWIERALLAGKHVFAEKPLTDSRERTEKLVQLARSSGLALLENTMFLHHSQHARVRELVEDGVIGELRSFAGTFTIPPKPAADIRYRPDVGGGALLDIGVYPVRAALHFLGPDCDLAGAVLRDDSERGVTVSGHALLCTPAGTIGELEFGMEHAYRSTYELSGSLGRVRLERAYTPPATWRPVLRVERQDRREEIVLAADDQMANVVAAFARAVLDGADLTEHHDNSVRQAALIDRIGAQARRAPSRSAGPAS